MPDYVIIAEYDSCHLQAVPQKKVITFSYNDMHMITLDIANLQRHAYDYSRYLRSTICYLIS